MVAVDEGRAAIFKMEALSLASRNAYIRW